MPKPVVTSRELKNKESGIDLYVTSYSVQKGLVSNTVHYQVVLVSNLSCFKSPSHKDSDVVQYSMATVFLIHFTYVFIVLMFEGQDLKRELTEDDEKDFQFIPDAIIKKNIKVYESVSEDHSDLFEIEDNLDQLLTVDVKKRKNKPQNGEDERSSPTRDLQQESHLTNPQTPTKPSLPRKPTLPAKPKAAGTGTTHKDSAQSGAQGKPAIPVKPKTILSSQGSVSDKETKSPGIESDNLGQDDILKYLQDNLASASEDVDLFS
uniref:Uncharacterized protein n=1 Tax=Biomphalaria glabrata TaxID=6526 RepID=A0A2C9LQE6_BIOGL